MKTLQGLKDALENMSPAQRRAAEYMLSLGGKLPAATIGGIAETCGVAKSTVVQTCKNAGYEGFKDLCNACSATFAASLREPVGAYIDIYPGVPPEEICRIIAHNVIRAIAETLVLIDPEQVSLAADKVAGARRILLLGAGSSGIAAQDTMHKLQRIGLNPVFTADSHCQLLAALTLDKRDCVIAFSFSGQTYSTVEGARMARERGAAIIAVTGNSRSALGELADIRLTVADGTAASRAVAVSSRQTMLTVMDMMATCAASRNYDRCKGYLDSAADISGRLRLNKSL